LNRTREALPQMTARAEAGRMRDWDSGADIFMQGWRRWPWLLLAWVSLALGLAGVVLPGLPTTPFVLLAAFAASRGSTALHRWLHEHPRFGSIIADWQREGAVSLKAKRVATLSMILCGLILYLSAPTWWMAAIPWAIMSAVAIWLWLRPLPTSAASD
jgi:uncharacterized membrane protein YbaN (DUF454 family)